jgi:small subunit ribosomal protein S8
MLTRVRNAVASRHARVDMPASKLKTEIARILQDEGYIAGYKLVEEKPAKGGTARPVMRVMLKYGPGGERVITGIQRVSRPGRRVYAGADRIGVVLGGLGVSILTTSRGVMTGQAAQKAGVGGEVLCNVW